MEGGGGGRGDIRKKKMAQYACNLKLGCLRLG